MTDRRERRIWPSDLRSDVDDELSYHLEMRERDFRQRGLSPADAGLAARQRFGDVKNIGAEVRAIDERAARERRRAGMLMDLRHDVNYALRSLRKSPAFTAVAVLTLALGIGANTAIFSVINAALIRPLPYADADRIVFVWNTTQDGDLRPLGPGRMIDFRTQATSFSAFAAISHLSFTLTGGGEAERIPGSSVSSSFFDVLGTRPLIGDTFHANAADRNVVVLTHGLWARRFGSDPSIVGKAITLNGRARLVVAVMPRDFVWPSIAPVPSFADPPQLWVPGGPGDIPRLSIDEDRDVTGNRNFGYIRAVARLRDGVMPAQARSEVSSIAARLGLLYPDETTVGATVVGVRDLFFGNLERPLVVLAAAVGFVLAIACANVASLLLGRGVARKRELAVRRTLGASQMRVVRQLLCEASVLSMIGAVAGILIAWWGTAWLLRLAPPEFTALGAVIDGRVLAFTAAVAISAGIAFGLAPALQSSRDTLTDALAEDATRSSGSWRSGRLRDVLVTAEIAVAVVLMVGASLLVRSFLMLARVDTGLDTHNLLTFNITLTGERGEYQSKQLQFYETFLNRVRTVPGVASASGAATLPIGGDDFAARYWIDGKTVPRGSEPNGGYQIVLPGYFATMGIPMLSGRDILASDTRTSAPVALVNETLARREWPGQVPLGRRIRIGSEDGPWSTIVGVVGDIRHLGPAIPPRPEVYHAYGQYSFPFLAVVVRTATPAYAMAPSIRRAAAELDPAMPLSEVRSMDDHLTRALAKPRFLSTLVTMFGGLAALLAVIGVYGMMAWSVAQRRREIAIRLALGARVAEVLRLVLRKAAALAVIGILAGSVIAPLATRTISALLFGIQPTDPVAFGVSGAVLAAAAMLAALIPARRAARIEPASIIKIG